MAQNAIWVYDFTISCEANAELDHISLKSFLNKIAKNWGFQKEQSESGYIHFQGRLRLKTKKRANTLFNAFKSANITIATSAISPTSATSAKADNFYNYVTKEDTRIDGPWTDQDEANYIPIQYRGKLETLWPWQKEVLNTINIHDDRKINWIYDNKGHNGKSTIANLARLHYKGVILPIVNDSEKLIQSLCNILSSKTIRKRVPIFIDLPRAMDQEKLGGFITAIEFIMSGYVYDVRNKFNDWDFDTPAIWVFSNTYPDINMMTKDRWNIYGISSGHELTKLICGIPDDCVID